MNRTFLFLASAAVLLILAVVMGLPMAHVATPVPNPPPQNPPAPDPFIKPPEAHPGSLSMTGRLSHPYVLPGTNDVFATFEVTAVDVPGSKRAPVNLAVVIDRSGSMQGQKIVQA